ncbi:MAG: hypothetical protein FWG12_05310 [Holophagaceae bacterium]|nr:hypothetical protein [Holophagaceae bacterium]
MRAILLVAYTLLAGQWLDGWTPEKWFESPKSDRSVHYDIKGVLDWFNKTIDGRLALTWKNTGTAPVQELPFHLYLNAFRHPDTAFMKTQTKAGRASGTAWGYCEIKSVSSGASGLSGRMGADETVFWYRLPSAVNPGQSIEIQISWEAKFPEIQFGSGWTGRYLVASMWHPKLGLYKGNRWICEPFDDDAAFQGDFGNYDVELSLPNALQLANTGTVCIPTDESGNPLTDKQGRIVEAAPDPERKLNLIYKIHAEDVQDFSWIAAPTGSWRMSRLNFGDLSVFLYCIPKNATQLGRLKEAAIDGLRSLQDQFGPYPYPILSIVDLPPEAGSAIASPSLAVISNIAFDPFNQRVTPERAIIQQLGDQIFGGVMASGVPSRDTFETALSAWFAIGTMEKKIQGLIHSRRFVVGHEFPVKYAGLSDALPFLKRKNFPIHRYFPLNSANPSSAMALKQLEAIIGKQALEKTVSTYVSEKSFKHPSHRDFRMIAERISKHNLEAFWADHIEAHGTLDYRIKNVSRGGTITLERLGNIIAPIELWARLEDGREHLCTWDGKDDQASFHFEAPISEAVLDPGHRYPGMKDRMRSTYTATPKRRGLHFWAQQASGLICGILQGVGVG